MCYLVPTAAAIATTFVCRTNNSLKLRGLNLMFYGGALFGLIDHLWNGELLLISEDWLKDLALGVVITLGIVLAWVVISTAAKRRLSLETR